MKANQLRLWFASMAYVLLAALRRIALAHTQLEKATCGSLRLKLLKIGAQVTVTLRRIRVAMASACPHAEAFALAHAPIVPLIRASRAPPTRPSTTLDPHRPGTRQSGATDTPAQTSGRQSATVSNAFTHRKTARS